VTLATTEKFLYTLLDFTIGGQRFTLVNDTLALTSNGVVYDAAAFKINLLAQSERGLQSTPLAFSNVAADGVASELGEIVFGAIQDILGEMIIIRRVFRESPNTVLIETPLEVLTVSITPQAVTLSVGFYNLYQQTLPRKFYDASTAPGLV